MLSKLITKINNYKKILDIIFNNNNNNNKIKNNNYNKIKNNNRQV